MPRHGYFKKRKIDPSYYFARKVSNDKLTTQIGDVEEKNARERLYSVERPSYMKNGDLSGILDWRFILKLVEGTLTSSWCNQSVGVYILTMQV